MAKSDCIKCNNNRISSCCFKNGKTQAVIFLTVTTLLNITPLIDFACGIHNSDILIILRQPGRQ